jgi:hypothetical protein
MTHPRSARVPIARLARAGLAAILLAAAACSDDGDGSPGGGSSESSPAAIESVRERLGDRMFEFGRAHGNSDRNAHVTGINQLQLCKCGLFAWKETTSFSSNVGSFVSEDLHTGTWTLSSGGGRMVVDLKVEQSNAKNPPASKQFAVAVAGDTVQFDGVSSSDGSVASDCEEAAQQRK